MQIFTNITSLQNHLKKHVNKSIGFVPTMGALHKGHLSLIKASQQKCDVTIVSIFVNPTQFAPQEDLEKYPHPIEADQALLEKENVDILFLPNTEEIYPNGEKPEIPPLPEFTKIFEGKSRPTHFLGVAQVVKRLFNIVNPTHTFFGQKDFQQTLLIKWLIEIFEFNIKLEVCPIIRESDGLALSSRNVYLNTAERKTALVLSESLNKVKILIEQGEKDIKKLEQLMKDKIESDKRINLQYAVILNSNNLNTHKNANHNSIALLAIKIGKTRLIDNSYI